MELKYRRITLRDYNMADIEDEIRWFNEETAWIKADIPWEEVEPVNETDFREEMEEFLRVPLEKDKFRSRLEIEIDKSHIGFVSSYPVDENCTIIPISEFQPKADSKYALGVEICESAKWGCGYGAEALIAYIFYHLDNGHNELFLETWSGNVRMTKCAEKIGFEVFKREIETYALDDNCYDRIVYKLNLERFMALFS